MEPVSKYIIWDVVEISWVQRIAVNLISFCWIGAYILKAVFPATNGSRKYNFFDVGVQQILVYH